ncbi:MAG: hypothetical protein V3T48_10875 [Vicinamibacterales bacterium]
MNKDFLEFLTALLRADARFLVVGAHAMAAHGVPRATGDLGVWVQPDPENAERVWVALLEFGAPVQAIGLSKTDLVSPDMVCQMGVPPQRIDLLTSITGLEFDEAWSTRRLHRVDDLELPFLGRAALLQNKRATGRSKDLVDVEILQQQEKRWHTRKGRTL